jgi:ubiquitin-conjugating enzyme E2 Z
MAGRGSAAAFTGQLSTLAQKRISKERQKLEQERSELEACGIYVIWAEELHRAFALIVGPEDTPYAGGFYFFDMLVPDNYPLQPPRVDFRTGDGRVRFNPNLYVEGKVCLSILGTWSGPSWTTSCNLRTVLVSIQSLLNEHPIQNEPGHEKETGKNDKLYTEIVRYENISVGVLKMLRNTPDGFAAFRPHMRRVFLRNYDAYVKALEAYRTKEGSSVRAPIWNFQVRYKPIELLADLAELRAKLAAEEPDTSALANSSETGVAAAAAADDEGLEAAAKRPRLEASGT